MRSTALLLAAMLMTTSFSAVAKEGELDDRMRVDESEQVRSPNLAPEPFDDRLLGDLGGLRTTLAEYGVDFGIEYTADFWYVADGGLNTGSNYLDNLFLFLDIDGAKAYGIEGNTVRINFLNNNGGHPNNRIGSIEGIDNIETETNTFKLYELWMQQKFYDDRASVLLGLYDLNSEFFYLDMSANFLKPTFEVSQEIAQTGENGPGVFPTTGLAARLQFNPTEVTYIQAIVMEGEPGNADNPHGTQINLDDDEGVLLVGEIGFTPGVTDAGAFNKFALGVWQYSQSFDDQLEVDAGGNPIPRDSEGIYALSSYRFYEDETTGQNFGAFLRGGVGDGDTAQTKWSYTAGVVAGGWVPNRPEGEFGLGMSQAQNSDKHMDVVAAAGEASDRRETGLEFYYRDTIIPGLILQPDVQYIINPGTNPEVDNAMAFALRAALTF